MKLFRFAALLAVAAIPIALFRRRRPVLPAQAGAQVVDTDHIFDLELRAD